MNEFVQAETDLKPHEHQNPEAYHAHVHSSQLQLCAILLPQGVPGYAVEVQTVTHDLQQEHRAS